MFLFSRVAWSCNGYDVGLEIQRVAVRLPAVPLSGNNLRQVVHTCASVAKQYKLVPVKQRRCPTAGKVTAGLASHWPCVTDFSGLSTYTGSVAYGREMCTRLHSSKQYGTLYLYLLFSSFAESNKESLTSAVIDVSMHILCATNYR